MVSVFSRFAPRLQEAIVARLGWTTLRPVQELAGEALLDGCNAVVLAPTAGGKTEASMFPMLSEMVSHPPDGVGALYIAPIKALLNNQSERLGLYTEMVGLHRFVWHGDTIDHERRHFLKEPAELLMTTPESLEVMLVSPKVDTAKLFQVAAKHGIAINPGPEWSLAPGRNKRQLRLCFAYPTVEVIRQGVAALAEVCHREMGVPERIANVKR